MRSERIPAGTAGWVWRREASMGGCVVEVPGPGRSRFWTDMTSPGDVVAFEAMDHIALSGLRRVFGDAWHQRVAASEPDVVDDDIWNPPRLSEGWRRMAVVEAVDQWCPLLIDAELLTIDRALALDAVGAPGMAAVNVATCSWRVVQLRRDALAGALSPLVAEIIRDAAALVVRSLVDEAEERRQLLELDEKVTVNATDEDFEQLDDFLIAHDGSLALTLGSDPGATDLDAALDLAAVSPRILKWWGPDHRELRVEADAELDQIAVSITLWDGVEPDDGEASQLVAYVADSVTGEVLSRGSLEAEAHVETDELSATLPLNGRSADTLVVGVYEAGLGVETRSTPVGRCLAEVDRFLVAAWSEGRLAQAREVPASTSIDEVRDALELYVDAARVHPPTERELALLGAARRRVDGLEARLGEMQAGQAPQDLALRPLLTELMGSPG